MSQPQNKEIKEYIPQSYFEYEYFEPNKNRYTDYKLFDYTLEIPPKLQGCETIDEFFAAKNYLQNFYKWSDKELLSDFVKVSCMTKRFSNIPTKKDLEAAIRKINKKQKK
jgi:hypothetical protein